MQKNICISGMATMPFIATNAAVDRNVERVNWLSSKLARLMIPFWMKMRMTPKKREGI
jgi:hypothetical protein